MSKLYSFKPTFGTVAGTEVPSHYLEIGSIQLFGYSPAILDRHDLVVGVDVGYVLPVLVNVRCDVVVHRVGSITELKTKAAKPVIAIVRLQRY